MIKEEDKAKEAGFCESHQQAWDKGELPCFWCSDKGQEVWRELKDKIKNRQSQDG